jgi:branched-chain amino acid transport system permease protein
LDYLLAPVVGTFVLAGSFEALRVIQKYQALLYACVMIAAIMWLPNGLLSIRLRFRRKAKEHRAFAVQGEMNPSDLS